MKIKKNLCPNENAYFGFIHFENRGLINVRDILKPLYYRDNRLQKLNIII